MPLRTSTASNYTRLLMGLRYNNWKVVFMEQRKHGFHVWEEPLVTLRLPKLFCLRTDPFERADENANGYWNWLVEHVFVIYPMQALAAEQIQSFREFPPRQKPSAFNLDSVLAKMEDVSSGGLR